MHFCSSTAIACLVFIVCANAFALPSISRRPAAFPTKGPVLNGSQAADLYSQWREAFLNKDLSWFQANLDDKFAGRIMGFAGNDRAQCAPKNKAAFIASLNQTFHSIIRATVHVNLAIPSYNSVMVDVTMCIFSRLGWISADLAVFQQLIVNDRGDKVIGWLEVAPNGDDFSTGPKMRAAWETMAGSVAHKNATMFKSALASDFKMYEWLQGQNATSPIYNKTTAADAEKQQYLTQANGLVATYKVVAVCNIAFARWVELIETTTQQTSVTQAISFLWFDNLFNKTSPERFLVTEWQEWGFME